MKKESHKNEVNEELTKLAPTLLALKNKRSGLKVPDNYFSDMQQAVLAQVVTPKPTATIRTMQVLSVAAAVLLAVLALWLLTPSQAPTYDAQLALEIEQYIFDNIDDFDTESIATFALMDSEPTEATVLEILEDIPEEDVEIYIENHLDELDLITLESYF